MNLKKKMKTKTYLFIMIAINLVLGITFYGIINHGTYAHEMAHKAIAENYGCTNYSIFYDYSDASGGFICHEYIEGIDRTDERLLHSLNEIVSYNISTVESIMCFGFLGILNSLFVLKLFKNGLIRQN